MWLPLPQGVKYSEAKKAIVPCMSCSLQIKPRVFEDALQNEGMKDSERNSRKKEIQ